MDIRWEVKFLFEFLEILSLIIFHNSAVLPSDQSNSIHKINKHPQRHQSRHPRHKSTHKISPQPIVGSFLVFIAEVLVGAGVGDGESIGGGAESRETAVLGYD